MMLMQTSCGTTVSSSWLVSYTIVWWRVAAVNRALGWQLWTRHQRMLVSVSKREVKEMKGRKNLLGLGIRSWLFECYVRDPISRFWLLWYAGVFDHVDDLWWLYINTNLAGGVRLPLRMGSCPREGDLGWHLWTWFPLSLTKHLLCSCESVKNVCTWLGCCEFS